MLQDRLFRLAPVVMHHNAVFVGGEGWHLTIIVRRPDELWEDCYRAEYSHLSTVELLDTIDSESGRQLGLT